MQQCVSYHRVGMTSDAESRIRKAGESNAQESKPHHFQVEFGEHARLIHCWTAPVWHSGRHDGCNDPISTYEQAEQPVSQNQTSIDKTATIFV